MAKNLRFWQTTGDRDADRIAVAITNFVNIAFDRRLRKSQAVVAAVAEALNAGYPEDEIMLAFWSARCGSDEWLRNELFERHIGPEIVLRFKGGMNNETGKPAKRWLDDCISRAGEMAPGLVSSVLKRLPDDIRVVEKTRLERVHIQLESD